jgi:putative FmdB family regulatory protein
MPIYVYQALDASKHCAECRDGFEVTQRMSDEPLKTCPQCGAGVRRVPQVTNVNLSIVGGKIADSKLKAAGFTKLTKDADGKYRRAFGSDPAAQQLPTHRRR